MADALFERELDRALRDDLADDTRTTFVPATDGFPLGATVVRARDRARGVVVLAPATGVRRRYYAAFQRWLAGQGFDVVTFDYRGIGDSRPPSLAGFHARMHHWGERDLAGVIAFVERELAPSSLLLVGHSVGGMIALLAAKKRPDLFDRVMLLGASACYLNLPPEYLGGFDRAGVDELLAFLEINLEAWSAHLAPMVMANAERPELTDELQSYFVRNDPDIAHHFAKVIFLSDHRA